MFCHCFMKTNSVYPSQSILLLRKVKSNTFSSVIIIGSTKKFITFVLNCSITWLITLTDLVDEFQANYYLITLRIDLIKFQFCFTVFYNTKLNLLGFHNSRTFLQGQEHAQFCWRIFPHIDAVTSSTETLWILNRVSWRTVGLRKPWGTWCTAGSQGSPFTGSRAEHQAAAAFLSAGFRAHTAKHTAQPG